MSNQRIENVTHNYSLNNFKLLLSILRKCINGNGHGIIKKLKGKANTKPRMTTIKIWPEEKCSDFGFKQNNGNVLLVRSKIIDKHKEILG